VVSFVSYFLLVKGVRFVTFFTGYNLDKLLFTAEKGQGLYWVHCAKGGKGCNLIFFLFFFYC